MFFLETWNVRKCLTWVGLGWFAVSSAKNQFAKVCRRLFLAAKLKIRLKNQNTAWTWHRGGSLCQLPTVMDSHTRKPTFFLNREPRGFSVHLNRGARIRLMFPFMYLSSSHSLIQPVFPRFFFVLLWCSWLYFSGKKKRRKKRKKVSWAFT